VATRDDVTAAQRELDQAVAEYVKKVGWDNAGIVTSWGLVMHQTQFDDGPEGGMLSSYNVVYMGGSQPDHIAIGLFQVASDTVRGLGRWTLDHGESDDEE
jgi:hypothetical protein